jgi:tripartite ATP-independent transporter DctM subunit
MSFELASCLVTLFVLAGIGTPIGYSILLASVVYLGLAGLDIALAGEKILQGFYGSAILLAVPLFIVAANIMNVVASLIFSGMSGSAVADAAGIGKIIISMMTKDGRYSRGYAAAITAASATIGPIIPPSIPMVLYALVSKASIGALFLAGILPGLIMGAVLMIMNGYLARKRGFALEEPVPLKALPRRTANAFPALLMPVILLYGIYGGVTTPTEAAAVAAFYALVLAILFYRALSLRGLFQVFIDSARSSASVGIVIGGAFILNFIVISEQIPQSISAMLEGAEISPIVFLLAVNVLILLLGCVLDATTIILVIVPLFIPTCKALGIDLVHFGVLVVVNSMIGLITPPYGILLFVINAVTGIPLREIISEIWAFLAVLIAALMLMMLLPDLVLWLPRLFGYNG